MKRIRVRDHEGCETTTYMRIVETRTFQNVVNQKKKKNNDRNKKNVTIDTLCHTHVWCREVIVRKWHYLPETIDVQENMPKDIRSSR